MTLSQDIMKIPGLSGSSFERQKQYWDKMGYGGGYQGSYNQNIKLINSLKNSGQGVNTAAPATTNLAEQYSNQAGANKTYKGPVFSQVLPFQNAWSSLLPTVEAEGASQINPFIQRDLNAQSRGFLNQLASTGGGRLGRATGGLGEIQAGAERDRKAQLLDWINQRKSGFENLFYNPSRDAFNNAIELGQTPTTPKIPTYGDFAKTMGDTITNQPAQGLNFRQFNF